MAKIGATHAPAMARLGLKEIAQALPAFPTHPIMPVEEVGLFGNALPQEVFNQRQGDVEPAVQPQHDLNMELDGDMEMEMGM